VEVEKWIGKQAAAVFEAAFGVVRDPLLDDWVAEIGRRIAAVSPRRGLRHYFTILDSDQVNAFALPGGYIFVTRGLLERAESDDEVACVLAHEVAHVARRHSVKEVSQALLLGAAANLLTAEESDLVQTATATLVYLALLRASRRYEAESDDLGMRYAYQAAYDPEGLLQFFLKLESARDRPNYLERLLATHPPTPDRISRARSHPLLSSADPQTTRRRALGLLQRLEYGRAIPLLRTLHQSFPEDTELGLQLAEALWRTARAQEAKPIYRQYGAQPPGEPQPTQPPPTQQEQTAPSAGLTTNSAPEGDLLKGYSEKQADRYKHLEAECASAEQTNDRAMQANEVNEAMSAVVALVPATRDLRWYSLLATTQWLVQRLAEASLTLRTVTARARSAAASLVGIVSQAEGASAAEQEEMFLQGDLLMAEAGRAAACANAAAETMRVAVLDLTPVLYVLLDPGHAGRKLTYTEFAGYALLAAKSAQACSRAEKALALGREEATQAALRAVAWRLSALYRSLSPIARETLQAIAARRLGIQPAQVARAAAEQQAFGVAVLALAAARSSGQALARVNSALEEAGDPATALARLQVSVAAIYAVLNQIHRQAVEAFP